MSPIDTVLQQPAAQAVGWALLHFIWQGALVGALTAAVLAILRRSAADVRYVVATIGLSLMLTMPIVTGMQVWNAASATPVPFTPGGTVTNAADPASRADPVAAESAALVPAVTAQASRLHVERWLPVMVLAWFCGVLILTLRLLSGWIWVQRMKSRGTVMADQGWQTMAVRLGRRLHIARRVVLLESALVDVPTVIGWIKPVVLLPASALAGLAPHQLEAILAHELAHIRRHDYLVNLAQALVETLLFYHPAVWWLSRRIRIERENCCDDLAVSLCGDPYTYAKALAALEELRDSAVAPQARAAKKGQLVMAADGGSLLQRVRRLLLAPSHAGREPGWLAGSVAVLVMLGVAAGAVSTEAPQAPAPPAMPAPPAAPSPPSPPALPSVPAPPQAPSAPRGQSSGNYTWTQDGESIRIKYSGTIQFSEDDTDVTGLSPGGYLRMSDGAWFGGHSVEFRADEQGRVTRRYWIGSTETPFEPAGRAWLSRTLPRFVRQSGIGAPARVARILEASGPAGVLAEISLIEGAWGKRLYFQELLKAASLDAATTARLLEQAGRELKSDYELASLLLSGADQLLVDGATRKAYFDAARTIDSDYEMRRVYESALKKGPVSPSLLVGILDASRGIESDYEAASLLLQVSQLQALDSATRPAFFRAVDGISSAYERGRVLQAVVKRAGVSPETVLAVLRAAHGISSGYETSQVLLATAAAVPLTGEARDLYVDAAGKLGDYDQGRVLTALVTE